MDRQPPRSSTLRLASLSFELNTTGRLSPEIDRKKVTTNVQGSRFIRAVRTSSAAPREYRARQISGRIFGTREVRLYDFLRDALGVPPAPAGQVRVLGERNEPRNTRAPDSSNHFPYKT